MRKTGDTYLLVFVLWLEDLKPSWTGYSYLGATDWTPMFIQEFVHGAHSLVEWVFISIVQISECYLQCLFVADGLDKHESNWTWSSDNSYGEYADNDVWRHKPAIGRISSESKLGSATGGDDECHPENGVELMRIPELHTHLEKIVLSRKLRFHWLK
jgi:hypothetical protein